eukprot:3048720-Pyramimonas_sp.AAC.1
MKGVAIVVFCSQDLMAQELTGEWKRSQKDKLQKMVKTLDKSKPWTFSRETKCPLKPDALHRAIFYHAYPEADGARPPVQDPDVDGLDLVFNEMRCRNTSNQCKRA